jgi:uncharacterized glyoxalase superfamily protein PhnB
MADRLPIDQLDDAVNAIFARREVDSTIDADVASLAEVARELSGLPNENFRENLRVQLTRRDSVSQPATIKQEKPKRMYSVTPYLTVHDPGKLIDFVTHAFGARERFRTTGSAGGMHAEVEIGDSIVMIGGASHITPMPTAIHLYIPDVDDAYRRAMDAGGTSLMEPGDKPYGERSAAVDDPTGNRWYLATPFVPLQEIAKDLHTVTVYFHPIGAPQFIEFLEKALGGKELMRHEDAGIVQHAKVQLGSSVVELGESRGPSKPMPAAIYLYVDDLEGQYELALKAGATSKSPPTNQPYGDRTAWIIDPFGHTWYLAKHIE